MESTSNSSPLREVSPGLYDLLQDLSDCDEHDQEHNSAPKTNISNSHVSETTRRQESLTTYSSPLVQSTIFSDPPCLAPETPSSSSVRTPLSSGVRTRRTRQAANVDSSPMPPPSVLPASRKRKMQRLDFSFKKTKYTGTVEVDTLNSFQEQFEMLSPEAYFKKMFTDELLNFIVDMTNLYSVQQTDHVRRQHRAASRRPLRARRPASHPALAAASDITAARPYRQSLVGERSERKNARRLEGYSYRPFLPSQALFDRCLRPPPRPLPDYPEPDCLNKRVLVLTQPGFANVHGPPRPTSHPIRVKAGHRKQYNPKKPHKWGFKFLDVQFTEWEENYLGVGGKTVVRLCKTISNPTLCTVYFDNWFTSLELLYYLRNEWGILLLGTIRKDRLRNCSLSNDKDMKKKGRGAYEVVCDNDRKLAVTKWVDNQCIHIASSFCAQDPVTSIERYDKKQKKRVSVTCPKVIKIYNLHMGGVDVADMLTALYRIHMKTRRWYMSIFAQVLDIALNNSWLLHRRDYADCKVVTQRTRHRGLNGQDTWNRWGMGGKKTQGKTQEAVEGLEHREESRPGIEQNGEESLRRPRPTKGCSAAGERDPTVYEILRDNTRRCLLASVRGQHTQRAGAGRVVSAAGAARFVVFTQSAGRTPDGPAAAINVASLVTLSLEVTAFA
ncbi:hypothetical protein MSG28_013612 [Choristoneura fumiferana]|uniref:Uncharacterized protein n=1 Tax=Choristoneura fumiferana TaxID=7141 RepID=A0ACC0K7Z9_CHOFU|nr:hypothetical protein MSG28_013612 [Choristoneura fumiferana]